MIRTKAYDFDNRDSGQMYEYLEARIDALKRRIAELEEENATLMAGWEQNDEPRVDGLTTLGAGQQTNNRSPYARL